MGDCVRPAYLLLLIFLVTAACSSGDDAVIAENTTAASPSTTAQATTTLAPVTTTTAQATTTAASSPEETTTTAVHRRVALPEEPPAWEVVTITTEDGVDLHAKYWPGDDVAAVILHGFDGPQGPYSEVIPHSSDEFLSLSGALAEAGHTVLSLDWRGHGQSTGEPDLDGAQIDMRAAYGFLRGEGYSTVCALAFFNSAPVVADLLAQHPEVTLAGLGLMWVPAPQEKGFDATLALPDVDAPIWIVAVDEPKQAHAARVMGDSAAKLGEIVMLPNLSAGWPVQEVRGMPALHVDGEEFAGLLLDFVESL
jgi:pimeloyl-ACP methyl ester carboxylesterase